MNSQKKEIQSVLILKNLYFENIKFERDKNQPTKIETQFDVVYKNLSESEIEVKLICNIASDTFKIKMILVGEFENKEQNNEVKEEINKVNTVSIMFPYLRSELSLLTAQPNFTTIDLPIVNIHALLESKGKIIGKINK